MKWTSLRSTMAEELWARSTHYVQDVPAATVKVTHSVYQLLSKHSGGRQIVSKQKASETVS